MATWILPSTLEDILAIVLAGLAGYVALLNLPLRRADAKGKLEKVANNFIQVCIGRDPISTYSRLTWICCWQVPGFQDVQCPNQAAEALLASAFVLYAHAHSIISL